MEKGCADAVFQRSLWALYFRAISLRLQPGKVMQQFFTSLGVVSQWDSAMWAVDTGPPPCGNIIPDKLYLRLIIKGKRNS